MRYERITLRLTRQQARRLEALAGQLWGQEELTVEEVGRRLLLEYLLYMEDQRHLVGESGY